MNDVFEKYYARIKKEALIKSCLCALGAAFGALFVVCAIFWFADFKLVWVGAIIAVAVFAAAVPAFYFFLFKPTKRSVAKRLDSQLGLEERMLTMIELENSNSPIAYLQKDNTASALASASTKALTFVASVAVAVVVPIAAVLGASMTTVSALSAYDVIPSGKELVAFATARVPGVYSVKYLAAEGGSILGSAEQSVTEGEDADGVTAIPDRESGDWVFIGWSDGVKTPARHDVGVKKDITVTAKFAKISDLTDLEDVTDAGSISIYDPDADPDDNNSPSDPNKDPAPNDKNDKEEQQKPGSDGAGGEYKSMAQNSTNDGKTYYGDEVYNNAYDQMNKEMGENDNIPQDVEEGVKGYFDTIKK